MPHEPSARPPVSPAATIRCSYVNSSARQRQSSSRRRRAAAPEPKTLRLNDNDRGYSGTTLYGASEAGYRIANTWLQKNL